MLAGPVFAIVRFDVGLMVVVGAVLLTGGPAGGVAVAVLMTVPLPAAVPVMLSVTEPPTGNVAILSPPPCNNGTVNAAGQVAPPENAGHVTLVTVKLATAGSVTNVPFAALGPGLLTTTVYVRLAPAVTLAGPVFAIVRLDVGLIVVVGAVLLTGGPAGGVAVAVLTTVPLPAAVPVMLNVIDPPTGNVAILSPPPCNNGTVNAAGQVAPPENAGHVTLVTVKLATAGSVTNVPFAALGPGLLTTTVYVRLAPAVTLAGPVFAIVRLDVGLIVVVGAVLLTGGPAGGVAVAVLTTVPLPAAVPVMLNVIDPPTGNVAILRPPPCNNGTVNTAGQVAPPENAGHVTPVTVKLATAGSVTNVPFAALGPGLLTTTVYVRLAPAVTLAGPVFAIVRLDVGLIVVVGAVLLTGGPAGGVAVAVLTTVPLPAAVPVMLNVIDPPTGNVAMLSPPPCNNGTVNTAGHVAPPDELGHVTPVTVKLATAGSVTNVPFAALGPGLLTTTVYVRLAPAVTLAGPVFAIVRLDVGLIVVVGAVLPTGGPAGGVATAVLTMLPLPAAVPITLSVIDPPTGNVAMLRPPPCSNGTVNRAGHVAPPDALGHVTPVTVKFATAGSVTNVPFAALGPGLLITTVYERLAPAVTLAGPVFAMVRFDVGLIVVVGAVLLTGGPAGGVAVAVFTMLPPAPAVPEMSSVIEPPTGNVPIATPPPWSNGTVNVPGHVAPPLAFEHATPVAVKLATAGSVTSVPFAALGPVLVTTTE